jgi:hypothetical protein
VSNDTGGAAFPVQEGSNVNAELGMSLRDWFAGQALIGILGSRQGFLIDVGTDNAPVCAYQVADAMLKARSQ